LEHVTEYFAAPYLVVDALEEKVFGGEIRTWVRWYSGSPSAWMLYGKFGDFVREEPATPELLKELCQEMGFRRLLDGDGIYARDNKTAFVLASRRDAAQFWPWPEDNRHIQGRRDRRGSKTEFDWEKALIEAAAYVRQHGLPSKQARLEDHIADWFGENGPDTTQIREHIGPLYRALKSVPKR
jgi:hypothetical protein